MTITVEIEGKGTLEFPDGTDPKVIDTVVKRDFFPEKQGRSLGGVVGRVPEVYMEEVKKGESAMKKMVEEPTGRSILGGVLGALQWGMAPLTAVSRGYVRQGLVEPVLDAIGIKGNAREFIGESSEIATDMVPYGGLVKRAITAGKAATEVKALEKMGKATQREVTQEATKQPLKFTEDMSESVIKEATTPISETQKAVLREDVVGDVINAVKGPVSQTWKPAGEKRITQEVVDYLMKNKDEIPKVLEHYGMSPEQLAAHMKETMSTSGRQLNQMAQWAKEIKAEFKSPEMQRLSEYMEKLLPDASEINSVDKFMKGWKSVENVRRGMLVGQVATTMRNIISQGARLTLGSVDDAFQGAVKGFVGSAGEGVKGTTISTLRGLGEGLDAWAGLINRLKPSAREKLVKILDTDQAIASKAQLYGAPVHEVALGNKLAKAVNYLNTTQEYFFRNIAFEAKLNQLLKSGGVKGGIKNIDPSDIPEEMLSKATEYALEMTFSAMPKSEFGKQWVKFMTNPVMTSLLNPFPRFMYGNALPFLKNFSPVGFFEAASPKVIAELVSGNPERFAKAASQATIGTLMLNTASWLRNSEYAGEKWYEVKSPGSNKVLDLRAFAPFSTYLFLAESMQNPEKVKPSDFASALFSLNRIAGTGLVLTDIIRGKKAETVMDTTARLAGEYLGSFSTPVRTFKDIYSSVDPEEAKIRDIREKEVLGPTQRNIPEWSQNLPESVTPLSTKPMRTEEPLLRQFTGLSVRTKNEIQKEVDRVGVPPESIYPRTGIPEGDREVAKVMAPIIEKIAPQVLNSKAYEKADDDVKRMILHNVFRAVKSDARKELTKTNPDLALKIRIENISDDEKKLLKKSGVNLK